MRCLIRDKTAASFAAALIGDIIRWAERQDMTDLREPAQWNQSLRLALGGKPAGRAVKRQRSTSSR